MRHVPHAVSLIIVAALSGCGDSSAPAQSPASPSELSANDPWNILAALPPEQQPYGLDVYTAQCASCHGALGQGVDKHPPLRGMSPLAMQQKLRDFRDGKIQGSQAASKAGLSDAEIAAVSLYAGE